MWIFGVFGFFEVLGGGGGVGVVEVAWDVGLSVGGGGADVSDDADLSGGQNDGLGGGGARWWVCCRFPRVCGELWEDFSNSLSFFFNFHCDVVLVSLERRNSECGWGAYW